MTVGSSCVLRILGSVAAMVCDPDVGVLSRVCIRCMIAKRKEQKLSNIGMYVIFSSWLDLRYLLLEKYGFTYQISLLHKYLRVYVCLCNNAYS